MNLRFLLLLIASLSFQNLAAQELENAINYTVKDGLPSNTVYCVEQDSTGFMWFGTDAGLSRFDGYEFINYGLADGLPDVEILNFFKDSKGRIWFYTLNGKVGFLKNGKIHNSENTTFLKGLDFDSRITNIQARGDSIFIAAFQDGFKVVSEKGLLDYFSTPHYESVRTIYDWYFFGKRNWYLFHTSLDRYQIIKGSITDTGIRDTIYSL
ncbi:MAG: hypothetical protein HRT61_18065, partial [Ekhidna sp.]|nr:hypothetical protein [Ekhidna sp.]